VQTVVIKFVAIAVLTKLAIIMGDWLVKLLLIVLFCWGRESSVVVRVAIDGNDIYNLFLFKIPFHINTEYINNFIVANDY
jgi:hypothetical protein